MRKITAAVVATLTLLLTACGTVPQNRAHFVELMQNPTGLGKSFALVYSKEINAAFDSAVANIGARLEQCIPAGHTQVGTIGGSPHSNTVSNNHRIEKVSATKAELTIQQHHTDMMMQAEGGNYVLAADLFREGNRSIRMDVYTATTYRPLAQAVEQWAAGSRKCHGIGGND